MEALVFLCPSLPFEIKQKYNVNIKDFCKGSVKMQFNGRSITDIEKARSEISSLLHNLLDERISLEEEFPVDQLHAVQDELQKDGVYLYLPDLSASRTVIIYHFDHSDVAKVKDRLKCLLVSVKPWPCKPEETVFLQLCDNEGRFSQIPARIAFDKESVVLKGTLPSIQHAEKEIESALAGVLIHNRTLTCHPNFKSHIKDRILLPFERRDPAFKFFIVDSNKAMNVSLGTYSTFDLYIFCKNKEVYTEACKLIDLLHPESKEYSLPEDAESVVAEMQSRFEDDYYVRVSYIKPSVFFHGLFGNHDQCYAELKKEVETTVLSMKLIPISRLQLIYFRHLCKEELGVLRKQCSSLSFVQDDSIQVNGTLKQVANVEEKLKSGLLSMKISSELFCVSRDPKLSEMWCRRWEQIKEKKKKHYQILITYSKSDQSSPNSNEFDFEIIGTDCIRVKEIKESILAEQTEVDRILLSQPALKLLRQARMNNSLNLNDLVIYIPDINVWQNTLIVHAPKECCKDLETAIEKIRKFVGDNVVSEFIPCEDPVVRLILQSQPLSNPYLTKACAEVKSYDVSVRILKEPEIGLQISGTRYSLKIAKPIVHKLIILDIKDGIVQKRVNVRPVCVPVLTTPDFHQLKSKLMDKFCVTCSHPIQNLNELISTSYLKLPNQEHSIQIDIIKGDIMLENVDAIVNAANEALQHYGGLAKAISDAGGPEIQSECDAYNKSNPKLKPGEALLRGPGMLSCKHVIHAVGPRWVDGKDNEEQILHLAVSSCLKLAHESDLTSIAIPAIGTGIFNVPADICAKASVKALEDFAHEYPSTCIRKIKFVLLSQNIVDTFCKLLKSEKYQTLSKDHTEEISSSPLMKPSSSPPSFSWYWSDHRKDMPYSADLNDKLNSAYQDNPHGSCSIMINSSHYTIDFKSMRQMNDLTKYERKVTKLPPSSGHVVTCSSQEVKWYYKDDQQKFSAYSFQDSEAIEKMYQSKTPGYLYINDNRYTFNFVEMCQDNVRTRRKRKIQRSVSKPKFSFSDVVSQKQTEEKEEKPFNNNYTLILQGPREKVPLAEKALVNELESYITHNEISSLPEYLTEEVRKTITEIALKNAVSYSFEEITEDDKLQTIMKLEGVSFKVEKVCSDIYKKLLHIKSVQEKEACGNHQPYPPEWEELPKGKKYVALDVANDSKEWLQVKEKFKASMSSYKIDEIKRIQNPQLWEKYLLAKKHLEQKNGGDANEKELFHGTRQNDPEDIYGGEDGFDMRRCKGGMWGNANYFAENAAYSRIYSHPVSVSSVYSMSRTQSGQKQMFLAKVLVGQSYECISDSQLRMPPVKAPGSKEKYDSVSGYTQGSTVYMTYDNARAYPSYLITYSADPMHVAEPMTLAHSISRQSKFSYI